LTPHTLALHRAPAVNPWSTFTWVAIASVAATGIGVAIWWRYGRKPSTPLSPEFQGEEPSPETPAPEKPEPKKPEPEKVVPPPPPAPKPSDFLPSCGSKLEPGSVYRDENGTLFFVRPDQERATIGASPLDIDMEWSAANAAWMIVAVGGVAVAAAAVTPALFLSGALGTTLAGLNTWLPSTVRLRREGSGVVSEVVGLLGFAGDPTPVPVRDCKGSVRGV
jgi:hypothetical protein